MDARIGWSLSAVGLVVMFIGARIYVGRAIEREATEATGSGPAAPLAPRPARVKPERPPDPLNPLKDVYGRVIGIGEDASPESIADAHRALDDALALPIEWTPDLAERAQKMLDDLENKVDRLPVADAKLKAHTLDTRVKLAERAGAPDADAAARLEALRASDPEAFRWE
ncbi:MAG: hypothetical protein H6737_20145 [Alphaproteobacteria bacterium]|nr:hypothetical protein [Alphaproteobacteria bacterium]